MTPLINNIVEDLASVDLHGGIGNRHWAEERDSERAWVRLIEEKVTNWDLRRADLVTSDFGNKVVDVGSNIPSSQSVQIPVGLNGGKVGVVGVNIVISGTDQRLWEDIRENDTHNSVGDGVGAILIEVNDKEGLVHEKLVIQQRRNECKQPIGTIRDSSIMSIVKHVGGDEDVLGKVIVGKVILESNKVLEDIHALLLFGVRIEQNRRIVLADVVVGAGTRVDILETLKACVWNVLLVGSEGDTLGSQKIPDIGNVRRDLVEVIVVHTEVVTTVDGTVVGLRWMGGTVIVSEGKTLGSQELHVC
jgi:hypothetical protein